MRRNLKNMGDTDRHTFVGTFERFGVKRSYGSMGVDRTVCLIDISDANGVIIADHVWLNYTKGFQQLGEIRRGEKIQFDARVKLYVKGYVNKYCDNRDFDYALGYPTKISRCVDF